MKPLELILCSWFSGYFVLGSSGLDAIRGNAYTTALNYATLVGDDITFSQSSRSRIQCAVSCLATDYCVTFSFDKAAGECTMSNGVIYNTNGIIYGLKKFQDCSSSDGYILLAGSFCLKHHAVAVNRASALSICESAGDHLLLIENESMHTRIKEFLRSIGSGTIWIDGFDYDKDNVYTSWEGKDLPYTKWRVGDPDNVDKQCVDLPDLIGFDFADVPCSFLRQFICQKNV